jgi:hypothetical protein
VIAFWIIAAGVLGNPFEDARVYLRGIVEDDKRTMVEQLGRDARVDAGQVNGMGTRRPRSGTFVPWREGGGGFLVWSLEAQVEHAGESARFYLQRPLRAEGELRFARGLRTQWDKKDAGQVVPTVSGVIVHPGLLNGERVVFEVAMPIKHQDTAGTRELALDYWIEVNGPTRPTPVTERTLRDANPFPSPLPGIAPARWPEPRRARPR